MSECEKESDFDISNVSDPVDVEVREPLPVIDISNVVLQLTSSEGEADNVFDDVIERLPELLSESEYDKVRLTDLELEISSDSEILSETVADDERESESVMLSVSDKLIVKVADGNFETVTERDGSFESVTVEDAEGESVSDSDVDVEKLMEKDLLSSSVGDMLSVRDNSRDTEAVRLTVGSNVKDMERVKDHELLMVISSEADLEAEMSLE